MYDPSSYRWSKTFLKLKGPMTEKDTRYLLWVFKGIRGFPSKSSTDFLFVHPNGTRMSPHVHHLDIGLDVTTNSVSTSTIPESLKRRRFSWLYFSQVGSCWPETGLILSEQWIKYSTTDGVVSSHINWVSYLPEVFLRQMGLRGQNILYRPVVKSFCFPSLFCRKEVF